MDNIVELLNEQMRINLQLQIQQMRDAISNYDISSPPELTPPEPTLSFYAPPSPLTNCMIDYYKNYKTDCYWFAEETTMGGHISICRKRDNLKCDCDNCKYYISRQDADEIIELRRIRAEEVTKKCEDKVKED